MPDRMMPPPLELATFVVDDVVVADRRTPGRTGDCISILGSFAGGGRRTARSHPCRSRSSVPATRCASPTSSTPCSPTSRPTIRSTRSPERSAALALAGRGRTNRIDGVAVLSVCDWLAAGYTQPDEFPDSLVDMAGPGAEMTRWGATVNVVVRCEPAPGAPLGDVDRAVRRASLAVARELARHDDRHGAEPGRDDRTAARRRRSRASRRSARSCRSRPRDRSPTRSSTGARSAGSSPRCSIAARAARRRADERRVRLAGRAQRHRELPGLVARPVAPRRTRRASAVRRAHPGARLPRHGVREATLGDVVRASGRVVGRRRRRVHDVLVRELPHGHDAHRAARANRSASGPRPSSARRTAGSPTTSPRPTRS